MEKSIDSSGTAVVTCPMNGELVGCGSDNVSDMDDEGYIDCLNCGLFFRPRKSSESQSLTVENETAKK